MTSSSLSAHGAALITGAGVRLGRAMAIALAQRGFDVAVHYNRSKAPAEETAKAVEAAGRRATLVQADLSKENEVAGVVTAATAALGPLAALVNSASTFEPDEIADMSRASWDRHMEANLRAPIKLAQDFAAQVPADGAGAIVNIIDQRVWKLTPQFFSYTLSKAALWTATRTMAQALAPRIRVNAVAPGPTLRNARQSEEDFARQQRATILERGSSPDDIVGALVYLLDAPAVTGQMIAADGGQHLIWRTPDVDGVGE